MSEIVCIHTYRGELINLPPHGYGQRGKYVLPHKVTGPDGKSRCRWCHGPVVHPRRTWCSDECVQEGARRTRWGAIAAYIKDRDKVCVLCRGATVRPTNQWMGAKALANETPPAWYQQQDWDDPERYPYCRGWSIDIEFYFEVDHIIPVKDGGTDDPENLRLLCRPCHVRVTAEWHAQKAAERRGQAILL